jgi:hypothetical protein
MSVSLKDQLVQICPFTVRLLTRLAEGVLEPVCNDGTSIAMMTPFNREKLETLTYLDSCGTGTIAALNCRMDTQLYTGPNIRFCVCMDGAVKLLPGVMPTDNLNTQTVIYANATSSLADLMIENGQPRTRALSLDATSSDEAKCSFVLQITPRGTQAHYSATNVGHIEKVSAKHISGAVIARALTRCMETRRDAVCAAMMEASGVEDINSRSFYMTLPVGSLYALSTDEAKECTVDVAQWHALVTKTSAMQAEAHVFKLCEAMVIMLTHSVAGLGVDIARPAAVHDFLVSCNASALGRNWVGEAAQHGMRTANECSFVYTGDSQIRGFSVRNRADGVFLEAQMDSAGEKQNLLGMDPLMCDLHLATKCARLRARTQAQLEVDLGLAPEAEHEALRARHAVVLGRIQLKESMETFRADCEDAAACLAAMASTAARMEPAHLEACVHAVMDSAAFAGDAHALKGSVLAALPHVREEMSKMLIALVFAHAASIDEMRSTVKEAEVLGVRPRFDHLVTSINAHALTGHACLFKATAVAEKTVLVRKDADALHGTGAGGAMVTVHEVLGVEPDEGTNPVDIHEADSQCVLKSASSMPMLQEQLLHINGEMPWTSANSIVSELVAQGARNVIGCRSQAVTSMTHASTFYHSMISLGGGYVYSTDAHPPLPGLPVTTRPTANIAKIGDASTRTFSVEGALLDDVTIGDVVYTEAQLLDMVVGASSCLAPSLEHIIRSRGAAQYRVLAGLPPAHGHQMARVVMHGRVQPLLPEMTAADHGAETRAREAAALKVHGRALAVSITSSTWNMYVPQG